MVTQWILHICAYTAPEADKHEINRDIILMVGEYAGAITAEHSVGAVKKDFLALSRTDSEIAPVKSIKLALDPKVY
jgi:FAD/FMN-containing dehydrogenase